ncbi:MAG: hypothetical protein HY964_07145 [Ignavibacteriales bacterium]|nr:hypothetical protein [Ignavibacteriales bacterium]
MNTYRYIPLLVAIILITVNCFSATPAAQKVKYSETKMLQIEANLVSALKSHNNGLQTTAAIILRQIKCLDSDYKFNELIIPLMKIVKDESYDGNLRIVAALALHDLKSARGDFAIKRTAIFTESEKVKQICSRLAWQRERNETP